MVFAKTPVGKGRTISWIRSQDGTILSGFEYSATPGNDADILGLPDISEAVSDSISSLRKEGVSVLASAFERMIVAEVNEVTITRQSTLVFVEAFCGFMRADENIAHAASISESLEHKVPSDPLFAH